MTISLGIKYQSTTLIFSKDNEWKPFFIRTGRSDVNMGGGDTICASPAPKHHHPIENGGRRIEKNKTHNKCPSPLPLELTLKERQAHPKLISSVILQYVGLTS